MQRDRKFTQVGTLNPPPASSGPSNHSYLAPPCPYDVSGSANVFVMQVFCLKKIIPLNACVRASHHAGGVPRRFFVQKGALCTPCVHYN